ncbi:MAG: 3-dehydroquinate synthase [Lentisphaerae bacterium]|nr:3-dehydroquinate synthase [Lentisphaerota bacterium]
MSARVHVELGDRSYDIRIGPGTRPETDLAGTGARRVLLVSDANVHPLHGRAVEEHLRSTGAEVFVHTVPAGEESKCQDRLQGIYSAAVKAGLDRRSVIVALGGGVVGDLAGFAAATFLRGVRLLQIPTSLLAMVDSSVGGKTAIDLPEGKNLVGAFHQPVEVCIDLDTLKTLPEREYRSGLAEVVKYGVIWDGAFLDRLEAESGTMLRRDPAMLEDVVARCCRIKADIVGLDEQESGVRAILNFGHTFGHAIENVAGYGAMLHGEAVSAGMALALDLSVELRGFSAGDRDRVVGLLDSFGLPTKAPPGLEWGRVRKAMAVDKKARASLPRFVLVDRMGQAVFGCEVPEGSIEKAFRASAAPGPG